jgi:Dyp-type peroxidase family
MSAGHQTDRRALDLADIQGNIVRPYGRFGFPVTRHMFFNIGNAAAGRNFIETVRHGITTAERWGAVDGDANPNAPAKPLVAINIGLSWRGLVALAVPTRTLSGMPEEFIDGMAKRWSILGDVGPSAPDGWDEIWRNAANVGDGDGGRIHVWLSLNAQIGPDGQPVAALEERTAWLRDAAARSGGVTLLAGHKGGNAEYQESAAIMANLPDGRRVPTAKENFGFTDGIADPAFAGQYEPALEAAAAVGGGKLIPGEKGWAPLATGEFILGHAGEAQELPPTAQPWSFMRNGTFMVYRKLHQNIASFTDYMKQQAALLRAVDPTLSGEAAEATVRAKMVGRWPSGIPLAIAPTWDDAQKVERDWADIPGLYLKPDPTQADKARMAAYQRLITDFRYKDDAEGARCPVSAHIRRTNPRDALAPTFGTPGAQPDSALTNRRRIMRRGLPYGDPSVADDAGEHGVIFIAICASLFRQFEFIQQQWVQYGASFNVGNDTDPLVGMRRPGAKFVIPGDPLKNQQPFICANLPNFVETRGGEYFFVPSLTALRQIAQGSVDPT